MWRSFVKLKHSHQFTFTLIIGVALISFWRGVWGVIDHFALAFFPGKELLAYVLAMAAGVSILFVSGHLMKELV